MGAAEVDGLVDALGAVGFSGVQGAIDVIGQHPAEGVLVALGGEVHFRARQVETDDALILEGHRQVGQLEADLGLMWRMPQRMTPVLMSYFFSARAKPSSTAWTMLWSVMPFC